MSASAAIPAGSIKHKILEAIAELAHAATSAAIRRRHPSNEHLVNVSIEQLTAAGLIEITSEGNYRRIDKKAVRTQSIEGAAAAIAQQRKEPVQPKPEALPQLPAIPIRRPVPRMSARDTQLSDPEIPVAATRSPPCPPPTPSAPSIPAPVTVRLVSQEPAVAKITCNKCQAEKAKGDFYQCKGKLVQPCKECTLARQKELRDGTAKPATRAAKTAIARRSSPAAGAEFVIPASGAIKCQRAGDGFEISQGEDRICASSEQLQALRDWASAQLKAGAVK